MIKKSDKLYKDFQAVKSIKMVPVMLDAVCRITGMGFATIARVTKDRWLACSVLDQVNFGLGEGGELKIETTICNEIRDSKQAVVIDNVSEDAHFRDHHTPKMYGLQSYISFPIILRNGEFFGTLCAIDTKPNKVSDPAVTSTFLLFAELISFHLQSVDLMERSTLALAETERNLHYTMGENMVYRQISDHNLLEHIRKIAMFSGILGNNTGQQDPEAVKRTARKINTVAGELSTMVRSIGKFSALASEEMDFKKTDLNGLLGDLLAELETELKSNHISVYKDELPVLLIQPSQIKQLFYQVLKYIIDLSPGNAARLKITTKKLKRDNEEAESPLSFSQSYWDISLELDKVNQEKLNFENIFDLFVHSNDDEKTGKYSAGLASCKKIAHNHGGAINAGFTAENGIAFSIILPLAHLEEPAAIRL